MVIDDYKEASFSNDEQKLLALFDSIEKNPSVLPQSDKSTFLRMLLEDLDEKPSSHVWHEHVTTRALTVLKLLGRDPTGSDALFSEKGIDVLLNIAGLSTQKPLDTQASREALKCLSNCILLNSETKTWLDKRDTVTACFHLLNIPDISLESQFLACRILFILTANQSHMVARLIELDIAPLLKKTLVQNVNKLVNKEPYDASSPINPVTVTNECLKLLFNLMLVNSRDKQDKKDKEGSSGEYFICCLEPIIDIIFRLPLPEPLPLAPPVSHAIHAVMQFPFPLIVTTWRAYKPIRDMYTTQEEGQRLVASTFVRILEQSMNYLIPNGDPDEQGSPSNDQNLDATLSPLVLVMRNIAESNPEARNHMRERLLPNEGDRMRPVNQGTSLPARLIRIMTSTMIPQTREAVSDLLFVLCDQDATTFTEQVGYGNAIGFLINRGIAIDAPSGSDGHGGDQDINPITGQYLSAEQQEGPSLAEMTDEEKEREAERLFVLFERLKKTGVVDVENPIAKAMRENRFEDVKSDESSDED